MSARPEDLVAWLRYLKITDCLCRFEMKSLGRLYNVSMGKGWVRMTTEPDCRHHGKAAPPVRRPTP